MSTLLPDQPDYEHVLCDLPDLRLHVVQAGPQDGRPVIMLHGFPDFWYGWDKQIGPLAEAGYRVIVPDQRGYNLSDKPAGISAYRLDLLAKDVVDLMDALGCQKVLLAGHDWGGLVAWATAVLYPQRVERLAVLDAPYPSAVSRTILTHPAQLLKSYYIYLFQLPGLPEAGLRRNNWDVLVKGFRRISPGAFSDEDVELYRQAWNQPGAITSMLNWYRALLRRPAHLPAHPRFEMPTLILWGKQDFALGLELAQESLKLCTNGELVVFEQANHWIQREQAEAVNQRLITFFSR